MNHENVVAPFVPTSVVIVTLPAELRPSVLMDRTEPALRLNIPPDRIIPLYKNYAY